MGTAGIVGEALDEKYMIERELGRGGMGTVYLATHLGTERPVAVKVIAPQFMKRTEFVERFRREARAAGRLRHPNVVNVTDFGFADTSQGTVAYLVMEYLDGCTLGEILEEEHNLPVSWTLDILDQVCSAVHDAHEQGIIHRDLKPDNIWLEPNQRGGYTVKVLDFGIAKLEEAVDAQIDGELIPPASAIPTQIISEKLTLADEVREETVHDSIMPTRILDAGTVAGTVELGSSVQVAPDQEEVRTRIMGEGGDTVSGANPSFSPISLMRTGAASDLTRVGAVLGTPLYMSPEQCRGVKLDARSDVYSLGVIAYQMLSGTTPFTGDFTAVMEAHKNVPPPPLVAKNVRRKLKRVIEQTLSKDPDDRPQTADAFANALRSRSEGIWALLRRASMIYTEHMPKFLMLAAFFSLPMILLTASLVILSFLRISDVIPSGIVNVAIGVNATLLSVVSAFCIYLIVGTITWIVTQSLAIPLRPIKLRAALKEARKKWKTFAGTGIFSSLVPVVVAALGAIVGFVPTFLILWAIFGAGVVTGAIAAGIGGLVAMIGFFAASVQLMLVAPVVMMENLRGLQALRRSRDLIRRSMITATGAFVIMFLIPFLSASAMSALVNITARAFDPNRPAVVKTDNASATITNPEQPSVAEEKEISFSLGSSRIELNDGEKDMSQRVRDTLLETLLQIFLLPIQIVVTSFTAIIVALLYLKTRQAGGESRHDLLSKFEETDQPRKKWQERVRNRLVQSGRITGRS